ncbi:MAG: hypothetical protein E6L04_01325 [Thaumarchaeota archaeon]|nr:MAG: hypothetical protein E6L04_01325 [Nitrososphaerota archaeon]
MTGDTFEKIKKGVKDTAEKITDSAEKVADPDTYTGSDEEKGVNREYNEAGGKEPMKPEDIAGHEPTAVKRDQDTEIAEGGQTGTDSPEAREKYKKSGMTDAK